MDLLAGIGGDEAESAVDGMAVRVDESGEERFAVEIDALGVSGNGLHYFRQGADGDDLVSADRNCVGVGILRVGGEDLGVKENLLIGAGLGPKACGEKEQHCDE